MEDKLVSKILENTFTQQELNRRLGILKEYLNKKIFTSKKNGQLLELEAEDQAWIDTLGDDFLNKFNKDNLVKLLDGLANKTKQLKSLGIIIPVEFPQDQVKLLGEKVRSSFGQNFLIDIKLDPSLIAGCALVWNGVMKDYSIRAKIDESKQTILETFKRSIK